jgi:hypothetical protein
MLKAQQPENAAMAFAMLQQKTRVDGQNLIIARNDAWADAVRKFVPQFNKLQEQEFDNDITIFMALERAQAEYGDQLRSSLQDSIAELKAADEQLTPQLSAAQLAELVGTLAIEAVWEAKAAQIGLSLDGAKQQLSGEVLLAAEEDSHLGQVLSMDRAGDNPAAAIVPQEGAIKQVITIEPQPVGDYLDWLFNELRQEPGVADIMKKNRIEDIVTVEHLGNAAASVQFMEANKPLQAMAWEVKTPEGVIEQMKALESWFKEDGWVNQLLAASGASVNVELQEGSRTYKGVEVHKQAITFTVPDDLDPQQQMMVEQMKKNIPEQQFAFIKGFMLSAGSDEALNQMIDRVQEGNLQDGLSMESRQAFGDGKQVYVDVDISQYFAMMRQTNPAMQMLPPITSQHQFIAAASMGQGRMLIEWNLPIDWVVNMAKSFMQMQQQFQQPAQPPAGGGMGGGMEF